MYSIEESKNSICTFAFRVGTYSVSMHCRFHVFFVDSSLLHRQVGHVFNSNLEGWWEWDRVISDNQFSSPIDNQPIFITRKMLLAIHSRMAIRNWLTLTSRLLLCKTRPSLWWRLLDHSMGLPLSIMSWASWTVLWRFPEGWHSTMELSNMSKVFVAFSYGAIAVHKMRRTVEFKNNLQQKHLHTSIHTEIFISDFW